MALQPMDLSRRSFHSMSGSGHAPPTGPPERCSQTPRSLVIFPFSEKPVSLSHRIVRIPNGMSMESIRVLPRNKLRRAVWRTGESGDQSAGLLSEKSHEICGPAGITLVARDLSAASRISMRAVRSSGPVISAVRWMLAVSLPALGVVMHTPSSVNRESASVDRRRTGA